MNYSTFTLRSNSDIQSLLDSTENIDTTMPQLTGEASAPKSDNIYPDFHQSHIEDVISGKHPIYESDKLNAGVVKTIYASPFLSTKLSSGIINEHEGRLICDAVMKKTNSWESLDPVVREHLIEEQFNRLQDYNKTHFVKHKELIEKVKRQARKERVYTELHSEIYEKPGSGIGNAKTSLVEAAKETDHSKTVKNLHKHVDIIDKLGSMPHAKQVRLTNDKSKLYKRKKIGTLAMIRDRIMRRVGFMLSLTPARLRWLRSHFPNVHEYGMRYVAPAVFVSASLMLISSPAVYMPTIMLAGGAWNFFVVRKFSKKGRE